MYKVESGGALLRARRAVVARRRGAGVSRTVVLLGLCSLLTDISSEMVAAVLPLYLVSTLGFSPLQFGIVDGLYQGATAFVRLAAGYAGDRWRRHKDVAVAGYGLSAVCKLALAGVGSAFAGISAVVLADRAGKGIRTAPRDAMISLSTPRDQLGTAFGVHRAMDTTGALLGPLLAFGLLALVPGGFSTLFVVSFLFALAGLGVLVLLVDDPGRPRTRPAPDAQPVPAAEPVRLRAAVGLLRRPGFGGLFAVATLLGLVTASDGFLYLALQRRLDLEPEVFPLLFTGTAAAYMLLAAPAGRLADRVGRARVVVGGYVLLLGVYGLMLLPGLGAAGLVATLALLGAFYAATDGVLMALASRYVPAALRGSGLALLGTATSSARLVASVTFGALWTVLGLQAAFACAAAALAVVVVVAAVVLPRTEVRLDA